MGDSSKRIVNLVSSLTKSIKKNVPYFLIITGTPENEYIDFSKEEMRDEFNF